MLGTVVGKYRIVSELGRGGMGMVYLAEHVQLGRPAAVKMLLPQLSLDPALVQRFFNEARSAAAIDHPGIVEIYDFGTHVDGSAYIAMALLRGESLESRLARGAIPPLEAATYVAQVAGALAAAHARGIVHRDLKPGNVFLIENEMVPGGIQVKLLDFGIAKLNEHEAGVKTQTGALVGTPAYMSPEQCMGRPDIDHRTDLYAVGCILFHALCGRPPFTSDQGTGMLIVAHVRDPAPHVLSVNPHVPDVLAAITMRLLEKDPAARFQSATELRNALVEAGASAPATRPPPASSLAPASPQPKRGGAEAYGATLAMTTNHGAAAEVVTSPGARPRSKAALWIAIAIAIAIAGGAIAFAFVVGRGGANDVTPASTATDVVASDAATVVVAPVDAAPEKPPITVAKHEPAREPPPASATPTFRLDAATYAAGATIKIDFDRPIASASPSQAWVTVIKADQPPTAYDTWQFVDDGDRSATVKAPAKPGTYEVRLHTDYPAKRTNLVHRVKLAVVDPDAPEAPAEPAITPRARQKFSLASKTVPAGGSASIRFAVALVAAPGEQFWITVIEPDKPDSTWGHYSYVPKRARTMKLQMPTVPGRYEIRLHANYPAKTTNVVHRAAIDVE